MARGTWYRLDNIGKFYSAQAGSSAQTVFRCAATLVDPIDEGILQHALDRTVESFPSFNVCLRSGMFWHYLEQSSGQPTVTPENLPVCFGLHVDSKSVLFRVTWYENRINLEVSHMVSDGRGTLSFFKTLLYLYVQERYDVKDIPPLYDGSDHQKAENSFDKYYEKDKAGSSKAPKVFASLSWRDASDPTYMEYHLPTHRVLELAHGMDTSLTSLVIAAAICAVRTEMPRRFRNRAIRFDIPVDLRRFFGSVTTKNFFGLAYVSYIPGDVDEPLKDIARQVQDQIKAATQPDALKARMNRMVGIEKNPFLRWAPMFVKDFALDFANRMETHKTTATVSNLGQVDIADAVVPYLRDIDIMTSTTGLSFVLCSFGDDLSIGISSIFGSPDVIKNFCRIFSNAGIEGHINCNKAYKEHSVNHTEAQPRSSASPANAAVAAAADAALSVDATADAGTATSTTRAANKVVKAVERAERKTAKKAESESKRAAKLADRQAKAVIEAAEQMTREAAKTVDREKRTATRSADHEAHEAAKAIDREAKRTAKAANREAYEAAKAADREARASAQSATREARTAAKASAREARKASKAANARGVGHSGSAGSGPAKSGSAGSGPASSGPADTNSVDGKAGGR